MRGGKADGYAAPQAEKAADGVESSTRLAAHALVSVDMDDGAVDDDENGAQREKACRRQQW